MSILIQIAEIRLDQLGNKLEIGLDSIVVFVDHLLIINAKNARELDTESRRLLFNVLHRQRFHELAQTLLLTAQILVDQVAASLVLIYELEHLGEDLNGLLEVGVVAVARLRSVVDASEEEGILEDALDGFDE